MINETYSVLGSDCFHYIYHKVLGQLPLRKIAPDPKTNPNTNPNPYCNRGQFSLGANVRI